MDLLNLFGSSTCLPERVVRKVGAPVGRLDWTGDRRGGIVALASSGGVVNLPAGVAAGRGGIGPGIGLVGEQCDVPSPVADGGEGACCACMSLCWSMCSESRYMGCIVTSTVNFFAGDAILSAKELLYYELNTQGRVICHVKDDKSIIAMVKLLVSAVKEKKNMPRFVIFSICETPVIGDAVSATLASEANEISRKID
ncbi:hypothetical protein QYM36_013794 [Artemia franciscana]|uniref:Uncharacterized protein n=1 Tax=Artemia franciscana TaxID=6661 RepID=A0AA88HRH2_ARTSF|nr:hypothetical protein QYM36_013794 [Artemia franciscana]